MLCLFHGLFNFLPCRLSRIARACRIRNSEDYIISYGVAEILPGIIVIPAHDHHLVVLLRIKAPIKFICQNDSGRVIFRTDK